jgi:Zn-dependent oligopeptidase
LEHSREKISLAKHVTELPGQSASAHLTQGYDAGYYGHVDLILRKSSVSNFVASYTYSLVFAADMYATVFKADPLDPERGKQYPDIVGGSHDT